MKTFRHWNIRYIYSRIVEIIYRRRYPGDPWLTKSANEILTTWLKNSDVGLEYGSGKSTLWLAKRVKTLTTVEHNQFWYEKVSNGLKKNNISNVTYLLFKNESGKDSEQEHAYVCVAERFPENSLDFVLIDGNYKGSCANKVLKYIRPSGILVIDNVNWSLPSNSRSHSSIRELQETSAQFREFNIATKQWRCIWTSSGVTDTAIFIKPL